MKAKYDRDVWTLPEDVKAKRKQKEEERLATSAFMLHFKNKTAFVGKDGTNAQLISVHALTRSKEDMTSNSDNVVHHAVSTTEPFITSNNAKNDNSMYKRANQQRTSLNTYGIVAPGEHNARRKAAVHTTTNQTNNFHENTNINNNMTNTTPLEEDDKQNNKMEYVSLKLSHEEVFLSKQREYETFLREESLHDSVEAKEEESSIPSPFVAVEQIKKQQATFRLPLLPHHLVHNVNKVQVESLKRMTPSTIEAKPENSNCEYYDVYHGSNARIDNVRRSNLEKERLTHEESEEEYEQEEFYESARQSCARHEDIVHNSNQRHSLSFQPTGLLWQDAFSHIEESDNNNLLKGQKQSKKEPHRLSQKQRSTESAPLRLQVTKSGCNSNNNNYSNKNMERNNGGETRSNLNLRQVEQKREKPVSQSLEKDKSNNSNTKQKLRQMQEKEVDFERKCNSSKNVEREKSSVKGNNTNKPHANNVKESEPTSSYHTPNSKVIYTPYSLEDYKAIMNKIAHSKFGGLGPSDSDEQRRARERKLREREYGMQAEKQAAAALALQLQSKKEIHNNQEVLDMEEQQPLHPHQGSKSSSSSCNTKGHNITNELENTVESTNSKRAMSEESREPLEKKEHQSQELVELEHHKVEYKPISKSHLRQPTPKEVIAARKRRERALQYGLQAASNLQKRHELINNNGCTDSVCNANNEMCANELEWNAHRGVTQQTDKRVKDADVIAAERRALVLADLESEHEQKKNAVERIRRQLRT